MARSRVEPLEKDDSLNMDSFTLFVMTANAFVIGMAVSSCACTVTSHAMEMLLSASSKCKLLSLKEQPRSVLEYASVDWTFMPEDPVERAH